jgi:hypothetical protein
MSNGLFAFAGKQGTNWKKTKKEVMLSAATVVSKCL